MIPRPAALLTLLVATLAGSLFALPAAAQTANPLRGAPPAPVAESATPATPRVRAPRKRAAEPAAAEAAAPADTAKPKRSRSPAQIANDDRMRKCGAEWRAGGAALKAQGQTWRTFNVSCRARLKTAGQ